MKVELEQLRVFLLDSDLVSAKELAKAEEEAVAEAAPAEVTPEENLATSSENKIPAAKEKSAK